MRNLISISIFSFCVSCSVPKTQYLRLEQHCKHLEIDYKRCQNQNKALRAIKNPYPKSDPTPKTTSQQIVKAQAVAIYEGVKIECLGCQQIDTNITCEMRYTNISPKKEINLKWDYARKNARLTDEKGNEYLPLKGNIGATNMYNGSFALLFKNVATKGSITFLGSNEQVTQARLIKIKAKVCPNLSSGYFSFEHIPIARK